MPPVLFVPGAILMYRPLHEERFMRILYNEWSMTPHRSSPSSVWYISVSLAATAFIIAVAAYYTLRRPAVPLADPVMVQRTAFVDSALGGLSVLSAGEVVAR